MYIDNGKLRVNNVNASIIKIPEVSRRIIVSKCIKEYIIIINIVKHIIKDC